MNGSHSEKMIWDIYIEVIWNIRLHKYLVQTQQNIIVIY